MKSARIHAYQEPLKVEEVPKPGMPHGEEVLVKIGGTGLCHSDLHIMQGDWALNSCSIAKDFRTRGRWGRRSRRLCSSASSAGGLVKGDLGCYIWWLGLWSLCSVQEW